MAKVINKSSLLISVFIIIGVVLIFFKEFVKRNHINIDVEVLQGANVILYILSLISIKLQVKGMGNPNPNVFVRTVMGSMMIKMFIVVALVFVYVAMSGDHLNKNGILISLFFYLIYRFIKQIIYFKKNLGV